MAFKNTRQRAAILELLRDSQEPMSAEEIHGALSTFFTAGRVPALSTVYRNLERFVENGLAKTELLGDSITRYTAAGGQHGHYLVCTGCSARIRIEGCPLSRLEKRLAQDTGFSIERHSLTIYGKCPQCRKQEAMQNRK